MNWVVLWYPTLGIHETNRRVCPQLMMESEDEASVFPSEADAERAAQESPASRAWPYIVVELP